MRDSNAEVLRHEFMPCGCSPRARQLSWRKTRAFEATVGGKIRLAPFDENKRVSSRSLFWEPGIRFDLTDLQDVPLRVR